jgi:hypothetical protein
LCVGCYRAEHRPYPIGRRAAANPVCRSAACHSTAFRVHEGHDRSISHYCSRSRALRRKCGCDPGRRGHTCDLGPRDRSNATSAHVDRLDQRRGRNLSSPSPLCGAPRNVAAPLAWCSTLVWLRTYQHTAVLCCTSRAPSSMRPHRLIETCTLCLGCISGCAAVSVGVPRRHQRVWFGREGQPLIIDLFNDLACQRGCGTCQSRCVVDQTVVHSPATPLL